MNYIKRAQSRTAVLLLQGEQYFVALLMQQQLRIYHDRYTSTAVCSPLHCCQQESNPVVALHIGTINMSMNIHNR